MNLSEEVDLEDYVSRPDKISNADIAAICQEAGMQVSSTFCVLSFLKIRLFTSHNLFVCVSYEGGEKKSLYYFTQRFRKRL
jgi:hypothetical protein